MTNPAVPQPTPAALAELPFSSALCDELEYRLARYDAATEARDEARIRMEWRGILGFLGSPGLKALLAAARRGAGDTEHTVFVEVSRDLLPKLNEWSAPVQIMVAQEQDGLVTLLLRDIDAVDQRAGDAEDVCRD